MKRYLWAIPLALGFFFSNGCRDKAAMTELEAFRAQAALEEEYRVLAERHDEAWRKGDIEALREISSPDYVWHLGREELTLDETIDFLKRQMAAYSERSFRTEDLFVKGDRIVIRYSFSATPSGKVEGYPAAGTKIEGHGMGIARVENGKLAELWEEFDNLSFMEQLGYELKPKGPGK